MNVSFIKQMKNLEREVLLKSVELDDDGDDFQFELDDFSTSEEIIAIAPRCVRCNTCVGECPVNAIEPANIFRLAKITDKCVKCEICVQTCPVAAIKLIDNSVIYDNEGEEGVIDYNLGNVSCSHRVVRMNSISIDYTVDNNWDDCANLCPTNAFTLEFKEFFDKKGLDLGIDLIDDELYPHINENMCIGCGACVEISLNDNAVELDRYIGPIVHSRNLDINHEACVNCYLCEENCPTAAIELIDGEVVWDNDKCIRCVECTNHCPVGALKRVEIE
ncbi:MAG: 4Fe-4S binding protein [Methanobrevibacter sp.]|uniref:4Fe-4S binding protein n=1 Tax=Methanobrevibacter sp. TaxID=66852 RepID=UPI0025D11BCF|nr:4Fe-4S binding protein [Methanobrevibacter sp.]MBQ6098641.1 4Fe-4S binding protein [Methanobrevibacter sp.]